MPRTKTSSTSKQKPGPLTGVPALPQITRTEANNLLKQRAQEHFHQARTNRDERIRQFEEEYGRADRIDSELLKQLSNVQVRFAAIAARQHRFGSAAEPKVSKFAEQLGEIIGRLTAHLAMERAVELFAPVAAHEYVGAGGVIGAKGLDESVLDGYVIVDDPTGPREAAPSAFDDEDGSVCLHENVEALEDEPQRGICVDCDKEFALGEIEQAA